MPTYINGTVGVWTGCGFDTIQLIFPPPGVLGYDACVSQIISDPPDEGPFTEAPMPAAAGDDEGDDVFVIIE
jgi:hypothetical protein